MNGGRHAHLMKRFTEGALCAEGSVPVDVRRALAERTAVPKALADYVRKVQERAYTVTDEDIAALVAAGYSEDAIFEVTVSTAIGAGFLRLERGLSAMRKKEGT